MRNLVLLIALIVTPQAFADVPKFDIVKSQDGKIVVCEKTSDLGKVGYRPLITTMRSEGEDLVLNTAVANLRCEQTEGKFAFNSRHPLDPIPGKDIDGNPTTEFLGQLKYLVIDRNFQVLGSINDQNQYMQALEYRFPLASSFSREDLTRLERGETLKVRWEFFLQGTHSIQRGNDVIPLGLFTGGSYLLNFEVRKNGGKLEVVKFQLN